MITKTIRIASLAAVIGAASITAASANDRPPNDQERAQISAVLTEQGYRDWQEIELDDGQWEVDNATGKDGRKHDIKLDQSFKIVSTKLEN